MSFIESETKDKIEMKKLFRLQKDGIVNVKELLLKDPEHRTPEERSHIVVHLKFKVPFFENYDRELLNLIVEKVMT